MKAGSFRRRSARPERADLREGRETARADDMPVQSGQIIESGGLVSIDRSKAAALLNTTPRLKPRSSTNDLAPLHCMGWVLLRHTGARLSSPRRAVLLWLGHRRRRDRSDAAYRCLPTPRRYRYRYIFGRDSDLEAFSHNPSDGSFAPLAYQPST